MKITIIVNFFQTFYKLSFTQFFAHSYALRTNIFREKSMILRRSINNILNICEIYSRRWWWWSMSVICEETETATPRWAQIQFRKASHCKNLSITLHFSREKNRICDASRYVRVAVPPTLPIIQRYRDWSDSNERFSILKSLSKRPQSWKLIGNGGRGKYKSRMNNLDEEFCFIKINHRNLLIGKRMKTCFPSFRGHTYWIITLDNLIPFNLFPQVSRSCFRWRKL